VAAEIPEPANPEGADAPFGACLDDAAVAVSRLAAAAGHLEEVADGDLTNVMRQLTTLVGQLDGLRVAVTGQVRDRGVFRRDGAASVSAWLRADVRTADVAWSLSQLAGKSGELPRISALLADGSVSLAQAGTACWQVSHLPDTPQQPRPADEQGESRDPEPSDDLWAGLWRSGDLHAAADELFARFLPRLDSDRLRALGAHLREAADAEERAGEDYDAYARRCLRLSRGFGGIGELSGRLHPEAAEQVLAAFEELGAKAGPDDSRTKAQRWADVLIYLTGLAGLCPPGLGPGIPPDPSTQPAPANPDDDQPSPAGGHGHDSTATSGAAGVSAAEAAPRPADASADGAVPVGLRRPRVIVTVPLSSLLGHPLAPGAVLGAGTPLPAEAARRLSCDAEVIRLITSAAPDLPGPHLARPGGNATGQLTDLLAGAIAQLPRPLGAPSAALDIGRRSQGWTPRQRDALHALYGGRCGAPGCTRPIEVIHHIVHWVHGGLTKLSNGAPFCCYHHWLVHEGGWQVIREPDGTLVLIPPPPGWRPGTIYRRGKPLTETAPGVSRPDGTSSAPPAEN